MSDLTGYVFIQVVTVKRLCVKKLPPILAIQLKRFEYDFERVCAIKFNDYFEFPRDLDMDPYTGMRECFGNVFRLLDMSSSVVVMFRVCIVGGIQVFVVCPIQSYCGADVIKYSMYLCISSLFHLPIGLAAKN